MSDDPLLSTLSGTVRMGADLAQRPEEMVAALRRLGYQVDRGTVIGAVPGAAEVAALVPLVEDHIEALTDEFTFEELLAALELLGPIRDLVDAIGSSSLTIPGSDIDWPAVAGDVGLRLPQMLLFDLIEYRAGWLVALMELLGLAKRSVYELPVVGDEPPVRASSVALDTAGFSELVAAPDRYFEDLFLPDGAIDHQRIGELLVVALGGVVSVERRTAEAVYISAYLDGYVGDEEPMVTWIGFGDRAPALLRGVGLVVGPYRTPGSSGPANGVALALDVGQLSPDPVDLPIGTLAVAVPAPAAGIGIVPGQPIALAADVIGDASATLDLTPDNEPWRLFGAATGPRVELGGLSVGATYRVSDGDLELALGLQALAVRLDSEGSDSFLANLVSGVSAEIDLDVTVSRHTGIRFGADADLQVRVPTTITIGPITLSAITVGAGVAADGAFELILVVDVAAQIGPFEAAVSGVGVKGRLRTGSDPADMSFSVAIDPPDRVAFAFTGSDVISGGGFLDIDHDAGRYSGGAALKIIEVGVSLLVVIDTQLPGGEDGWAFFGSLGIDIPGIPLGFGFTLQGVGGLIGLNRRMDHEALAVGLRQGAADAILFPDDPVRDALVLIPQIDAYFPIEVGNTVIGPVVAIGWGAPVPLVTAQIGVLISLPQGVVAVLGSIAMALPTPDAPLIEITMDSLGVIDLVDGTVSVTASLYDSRLLGVIELSGDMAFYVATSPQPYFALAIGGWHPAFQPPSILPAVFSDLRRIRAEIALTDSIGITFTAYLALTPNTVQFGGKFDLEASVKVLFTTYTAKGWFGFDVLLIFSPFKLVADVTAGVGVYSGKKELMGVSLGAHVEGPDPWFASGYARFKFFGVKVKFDFTVGAKASAVTPPTTDLMELMEPQFLADDIWAIERGSGLAAGLIMAEVAEEDTPPMLADGTITMRQTIAPLERTIEVFGTNRVAQSRIDIDRAVLEDATTNQVLAGVTADPVDDWFAPAQFDDLSDTEKLAAPSYELERSGVRFGTDAALTGDGEGQDMPLGHETKLWQPPPDPDEPNSLPTIADIGITRGDIVADGWFDVAAIAARAAGLPTVMTSNIYVAAAVGVNRTVSEVQS